jgi:hypothetical protein
VKRNRRQTLKDLTARFNNRTGYNVSERTVRRRLCFGGYKRRMICKKITISRVNRDRRMGLCRQKLHWNVQNNWSSIIFSDETKIRWCDNDRSISFCSVVNSLPCLAIFLADDFCLPKGNKSDENYVIVNILIQKQ